MSTRTAGGVSGEQAGITVVVVDDHGMVADGLQRTVAKLPGVASATVCASGDELLRYLSEGQHVDVCTLDLMMPGTSGLELIGILSNDWPDTRVLVCTANASAEVAVRCLRAGAAGFISKFRPARDFAAAVTRVASGERYVDADLMSEVVERLAGPSSGDEPHRTLSAREFAVMEALARGEAIKDIAAALYLSPKTVTTYRARVLAKLRLRSNAEVTAYALRHGLVHLDAV